MKRVKFAAQGKIRTSKRNRSSGKPGKIPPRAPSRGRAKRVTLPSKRGSSNSRVCFYENSSPIRATIFPLTKQDTEETESLSRYGCFAYRSSNSFSSSNEFRFNALPRPLSIRAFDQTVFFETSGRGGDEGHERGVIEPLKLSFADPNFVVSMQIPRSTSQQTFRPSPSPHFIGEQGRDTTRYVLGPKSNDVEEIDGCTKWKMFDRRCCLVRPRFPRRQLITTYTMHIF